MHHLAYVWKREGFFKPWHAECACHSAGDFATDGEAKGWIASHFQKLTGICTSELKLGDPTPKPIKKALVVPTKAPVIPPKVAPPAPAKVAAAPPPPKAAAPSAPVPPPKKAGV